VVTTCQGAAIPGSDACIVKRYSRSERSIDPAAQRNGLDTHDPRPQESRLISNSPTPCSDL
jgi:hypothetical protein